MKLRKNGLMVYIFIVLIFFLVVHAPSAFCDEEAGACQKAYLRCVASCLPSLLASLEVTAACVALCTTGYLWCAKYYY
jgi:hypothetical protein